MNYVIGYLKNRKAISILAPLFKMLEAIFELLVPLVVASIIDVGIANGDRDYIIRQFAVLILLAVVGVVSAITAQYFAAKAAISAATEMRSDLYRHILKFSDTAMDHFGSSTLTTRLTNDVTQVQNGINMVLRLFLRSPFIVFGAFFMALTIDTRASFLLLGVIVCLTAIVVLVMKLTLPGFLDVQQKLDLLLLRVSENLEGVRVLRAFRQEKREKKAFGEEAENLYKKQTGVGVVSAVLNPFTYVLVNVGIILLLYDSSFRVEAGVLTQGQVVALANYFSQILVELLKLANLILLLTRALSSVERLEEIHHFIPDEREVMSDPLRDEGEKKETGTQTAVEFSGVSYTYPKSASPAVEGVNFSVGNGSSFGIIGGTGSGKSTLIRLITHAFDATEGRVTIFGKDIQSYKDHEIFSLVGCVPQKAELFKGTVRSNFLMAKADATEEEMWTALSIAQMEEMIREETGGLDALVERGGANFSGGQRQRLTIARTILKQPKILILDDSASALDLVTEKRLKQALFSLPWKPTIFFISQRASSVLDTDRIIVLENGEIKGCDAHEQLLRTCDVYREIYECQFPPESHRKGGD